ncbi:MAG: hypothetical protein ACREEU_00080 [Acetobacteraceae bacterium]
MREAKDTFDQLRSTPIRRPRAALLAAIWALMGSGVLTVAIAAGRKPTAMAVPCFRDRTLFPRARSDAPWA